MSGLNLPTAAEKLRRDADAAREDARYLQDFRNGLYEKLGKAKADIEAYEQYASDLEAAVAQLDAS